MFKGWAKSKAKAKKGKVGYKNKKKVMTRWSGCRCLADVRRRRCA